MTSLQHVMGPQIPDRSATALSSGQAASSGERCARRCPLCWRRQERDRGVRAASRSEPVDLRARSASAAKADAWDACRSEAGNDACGHMGRCVLRPVAWKLQHRLRPGARMCEGIGTAVGDLDVGAEVSPTGLAQPRLASSDGNGPSMTERGPRTRRAMAALRSPADGAASWPSGSIAPIVLLRIVGFCGADADSVSQAGPPEALRGRAAVSGRSCH